MNTLKKYNILIPILIIMIFSLLNMINARLIDEIYYNHFSKQLLWYIVGFITIFLIQKINIDFIFKISFPLYIISIVLLILVLFIGIDVNGAKAWFSFGPISFQPSELTKLTLAIYLTNVTNKFNLSTNGNSFLFIIKLFFITLVPSLLVFIEPDTGAIVFYLIILLVCLLNSKINKKWFILIFLTFLSFLSFFIYLYFFNKEFLIDLIGTTFFYRIDRLINFSDNYQINNALTLIGSSSFFGSGLNSISLFVPESPTDFIFAFTIGNFGLFSGIVILLSYLFIDIILISYIKKTNNKLFLFVFVSIFLFQQFFNILMNLGLMPIMGIPLVFLSYGGSSLIIIFIFIGINLKLI